MRTTADPDEPTSGSELREALDAAAGRGQQEGTAAGTAPEVILAGPGQAPERARRYRAWLSGTMQNAVGGVITWIFTLAALALAGFLAAHFLHHPGHPAAPGQPRATATSR